MAIYLDSYPTDDEVPSTIVDVTGPKPLVLRTGAIPLELLQVAPETTVAAGSP